jgi:hypothetical protein
MTRKERGTVIEHATIAQGSRQWFDLRLGKPTVSNFGRILGAAKLNYTKGRAFLCQLLAERILGKPVNEGDDEFSSLWTDRGTDLEPVARSWWAYERNVEPREIGFATTGDGLVGGSPDALGKDDQGNGGAEIKVRGAGKCIEAALGFDDSASPLQIQGHLWLFEADWWDSVGFNDHHGIPNTLVRHYPVERYQKALDAHLSTFLRDLERGQAILAELGPARIDAGTLQAQLLASLKWGTEPQGEAYDLDQIDGLRQLVHWATRQAPPVIDADDAGLILADIEAGKWDSVSSMHEYLERCKAAGRAVLRVEADAEVVSDV